MARHVLSRAGAARARGPVCQLPGALCSRVVDFKTARLNFFEEA